MIGLAKAGTELWKFSEPVVKTVGQVSLGILLFQGLSALGTQAKRGVNYVGGMVGIGGTSKPKRVYKKRTIKPAAKK